MMTNHVTTCPTLDSLRRYAMGQYSDDEGDTIEQHLSLCDTCEETLANLDDAADSLVRYLPLAAVEDGEGSEPSHGWLQRLIDKDFKVESSDRPKSASANAEPAPTDLGPYELTGVLGQGGMGVVYQAKHRQLGRTVAIKVVSPKTFAAPEAKRRFDREIQVLGQLHHPGIVSATDAGRIGDAPYLVMELIDGVDLGALVRKTGPLSVSESCEVARQIALALSAAHDAGAIHRDVKPSNVMIDRNGNAKLLDFGLAHLTDSIGHSQETSIGRLLGTLDYMAPEQADGGPIGTAVDVYGLGATLYFLLSGRPPKRSDRDQTLVQRLRQITDSDALPLNQLRSGIPDELNELVQRMLNNEPESRPQDLGQLSESLSQWADEGGDALTILAQTKEGSRSGNDFESVAQSLVSLVGKETAADVLPPNDGRGTRRAAMALLALAVLGPLLYFGIVIVLQTEMGTVRIESDVPGVTVELLDEKNRVRRIQIENLQHESQIRAGKYRVRLAEEFDSLMVDPNEFVLTKDDTEIARVTVQRQVAADVADQADELFPDVPLYKGFTEQTWRRRYDSDTNPVSKLEAATALVTLASNQPDQQRVMRTIELGGDLLQLGYGRQLDASISDIGIHRRIDLPLWPKNETESEWHSFIAVAGGQWLDVRPEAIVEAVSAGNFTVAQSAFALFLLGQSDIRKHVIDDQQSTDKVAGELGRTWPELVRQRAFLVRDRFARNASPAARRSFLSDLNEIGYEILDSYEQSLAQTWADLARLQPLDNELLARVVLRILLDEPRYAHHTYFQFRWYSEGEFAYPDAWMTAARKYGEPIWSNWIPVANQWLREHPESDADSRAVIATMDVALRVRAVDDDWPIDDLAQILTDRLRKRYESDHSPPTDATSTHDLLAFLILAGGDLPEFVMQDTPALHDAATLARYRRAMKGDTENGFRSVIQSDMLELRSAAPVTLLRTAIEKDKFDPIDLLSSIPNIPGLDDKAPSIEPLLVLAVASKLTGVSEDQDVRIAFMFGEGHPGREFARHIRDAVSYPFAIREVANRWLREMRSKAVSDELKKAVDELLPPEEPELESNDGR